MRIRLWLLSKRCRCVRTWFKCGSCGYATEIITFPATGRTLPAFTFFPVLQIIAELRTLKRRKPGHGKGKHGQRKAVFVWGLDEDVSLLAQASLGRAKVVLKDAYGTDSDVRTIRNRILQLKSKTGAIRTYLEDISVGRGKRAPPKLVQIRKHMRELATAQAKKQGNDSLGRSAHWMTSPKALDVKELQAQRKKRRTMTKAETAKEPTATKKCVRRVRNAHHETKTENPSPAGNSRRWKYWNYRNWTSPEPHFHTCSPTKTERTHHCVYHTTATFSLKCQIAWVANKHGFLRAPSCTPMGAPVFQRSGLY